MQSINPSCVWTDSFLDPFVSAGDRIADNAIGEALRGAKPEAFYGIIAEIKQNSDEIPGNLPPGMNLFFEQSQELPPWADLESIQIAQDVFARYGMPIVLTLFCIVLPEGYAIWKPTWILHKTNNLGKHLHRRIIETAQFLLDVMAPGGLGSEGRGIRSIQKVRLIHAAVRHYIVEKTDWPSEWGVPINQEDMAATIGGFSYLSLEGLAKLNIQLSPREQEAYLHAWSVIGHMLGVDERLRLATMESARDFMQAYRSRGRKATAQGVELTRDLVQFLRGRLVAPRLRSLPEALIVYFMGSEAAPMLGLATKDHPWLRPVLGFSRWMDRMQHRSRRLQRITARMTYAIFERLLWVETGGESRFHIPLALRESWNIDSVYRRVERQAWAARCRVFLHAQRADALAATPVNVSEHGIRLLFDSQSVHLLEEERLDAPGARLRLQFETVDGEAFHVSAVVTNAHRHAHGMEIGLRFSRRDFSGRRRVRALLASSDRHG